MLKGPELRTIFLGMDQIRDELLYSNVKGKNPFKDIRVREAFFKAVDIELIKTRVMRGLSTPSALMIAPQLFPLSKDFTRPKFDPDGAKKLLTEAGYPDGFEVTMDCPNDRYVNDAAICQAVVGMLARIGVKINLLAQPKAQYFAKVLKPGGYQTSFYMLGWTPGTFDAQNVLYDIMGCRDDPKSSRGEANLGGYCNKQVDAIADKVLVETDTAKRDLLIKEAFEIAQKDYGYIPLHQQALAWGVSKKRETAAARRQSGHVLLGDQTGIGRLHDQVPAASGFRDFSFPADSDVRHTAEREVKGSHARFHSSPRHSGHRRHDRGRHHLVLDVPLRRRSGQPDRLDRYARRPNARRCASRSASMIPCRCSSRAISPTPRNSSSGSPTNSASRCRTC